MAPEGARRRRLGLLLTIILHSIPFFFVLMGLEWAIQAVTGRRLPRVNDIHLLTEIDLAPVM
jgi:hypothetical protein